MLVILCNPNNPTGVLLERKDIIKVAEACAAFGGILAVDEAFLEFCADHDCLTMMSYHDHKNVAVIRSLTKLFAIPGLRLGFLTGPAEVLKKVEVLRDPWSVNVLAQLAGEYVLLQDEYIQSSVDSVARLAAALASSLARFPELTVFWPSANYIFMQSNVMTSGDLQAGLLREKVLIRDCSNYRGLDNKCVRVAVRTAEENQLLLEAMEKVFLQRGGRK